MHPPSFGQAAKSHPQIEKHNAEAKTATNKILQQKCKRLTQSQDWEASLCATSSKNKKLDTRTHHQKTKLKNIQGENVQWGNLHQEQKLIKPQYTDSKQSLQTTRMTTDLRGQLEQLEHNQRPR